MQSQGEIVASAITMAEAVRAGWCLGCGKVKEYEAHVFNLVRFRDEGLYVPVFQMAGDALTALQVILDSQEKRTVDPPPLTREPKGG